MQCTLDKVQRDDSNNKFGHSERDAKIRELERKLKRDQVRVKELEREKDAKKEEVRFVFLVGCVDDLLVLWTFYVSHLFHVMTFLP